MIRSISISLLLAFIFLGCETEMTESSPETVFENDYAKVSFVSLESETRQPKHFGEDRIVYSLNNYTIEFQQDRVDSEENQWERDDIHFHQAGEHRSINAGTRTAEWVVFERKTVELPPADDLYTDIEEDLSLNETILLFENDLFKVTKVRIESGMAIPEHEGRNRVVYSLSNYTIEYKSEDDEDRTREFQTGDVHWHRAAEHSVDNVGDTTAEFLIVVYKN